MKSFVDTWIKVLQSGRFRGIGFWAGWACAGLWFLRRKVKTGSRTEQPLSNCFKTGEQLHQTIYHTGIHPIAYAKFRPGGWGKLRPFAVHIAGAPSRLTKLHNDVSDTIGHHVRDLFMRRTQKPGNFAHVASMTAAAAADFCAPEVRHALKLMDRRCPCQESRPLLDGTQFQIKTGSVLPVCFPLFPFLGHRSCSLQHSCTGCSLVRQQPRGSRKAGSSDNMQNEKAGYWVTLIVRAQCEECRVTTGGRKVEAFASKIHECRPKTPPIIVISEGEGGNSMEAVETEKSSWGRVSAAKPSAR